MKKIYAFSLVEILIGLITISLIMTAFAPIFTKKINSGIALGDGSKKNKPFNFNPMDPDCTPHLNSLDCKFKTPPNVSRLSAVLVSGGGGGAGGSAGNKVLNQSIETNSGYKEIAINKYMKNVKITSLIGGGGGGGGGAFKNWNETKTETTTTPAQCSFQMPSDSVCRYIFEDQVYGFTSERYETAGLSSNPTKRDRCVALISQQAFIVAQDYANKNSSLPKGYNEILQCAYEGGRTILTCPQTSATNDICKAVIQLTKHYYATIPENLFSVEFYAMPGTNPPKGYIKCYYDGSQCEPKTVETTTTVPYYTSSGGGGGSMGSRVENVLISDSIIKSAVGGKIRITAGAAGTAGTKGASNGASGGTGGTGGASSITVYNSSGSAIYTVSVSGGNGGRGATITGAGAGGSASNTCSNAACSQTNPAGNTGTINANKTTNTTSQGGSASGSSYGMGGTGGSATGTTSNAGTAGGGGYGKITYELHYDGAAGGGGGGSSIIHIDNIPVTPNKEYTIRIGGGGKGGGINTDGSAGGESAIWFDNLSVSISGGAGGKKGTSQTSTTNPIQGAGGEKGVITKTGAGGSVFLQKDGSAGGSGAVNSNGSTGGAGGLSGGQMQRACGGFQSIVLVCNNGLADGETLRFENYGNIYSDGNYGVAGSGGGGGGWYNDTTLYSAPGIGGAGQNGYVYLYY